MSTPVTPEAEFLPVAEVAARLRVSPLTVYRRVADGTLAAVRLGEAGPIRIRAADLEESLLTNRAPRDTAAVSTERASTAGASSSASAPAALSSEAA